MQKLERRKPLAFIGLPVQSYICQLWYKTHWVLIPAKWLADFRLIVKSFVYSQTEPTEFNEPYFLESGTGLQPLWLDNMLYNTPLHPLNQCHVVKLLVFICKSLLLEVTCMTKTAQVKFNLKFFPSANEDLEHSNTRESLIIKKIFHCNVNI